MAVSQRRALGTLFLLLAVFFVGIAIAAFTSDFSVAVWGIGAAAAVIALWLAGMAARGLRRPAR